jgi:ANTAR domain/GAF domain
MLSTDMHHPAVNAALSTAATLLGMEVVFIGGLSDETFTFHRIHGEWPGVVEGTSLDRSDTLCHLMLAGGPVATCDAEAEPAYRESPVRTQFGIRSYVGVPIVDASGAVVGTLCGIDHGCVPVEESTVAVLRELAKVVAAHLGPLAHEGVVIRRTPDGWQVAGDDAHDLTSAMVLADLIAAELEPGGRPPRADGELDEVAQLRLSVAQLEHALTARVAVEQAIGVLAERQHVTPRMAFERLRKAARSRGRKVHDLSREVIASVNDRSVPLPPELAPRR